jgi:hypothetical protein
MGNQTYKEICLLSGIYLTADKFVLAIAINYCAKYRKPSVEMHCFKFCKIPSICLKVIRGVKAYIQTCDMVQYQDYCFLRYDAV